MFLLFLICCFYDMYSTLVSTFVAFSMCYTNKLAWYGICWQLPFSFAKIFNKMSHCVRGDCWPCTQKNLRPVLPSLLNDNTMGHIQCGTYGYLQTGGSLAQWLSQDVNATVQAYGNKQNQYFWISSVAISCRSLCLNYKMNNKQHIYILYTYKICLNQTVEIADDNTAMYKPIFL